MRLRFGACVSAAGLLTLAGAHAQTTAIERVIEYDQLTAVMEQAAASVADPIEQSQINQRFGDVIELLREGEPAREDLAESLGALNDEVGDLIQNLDQQALWTAQDEIAATVDRVRMYLARGPLGVPNSEVDEQTAALDRQLENLAVMIDEELDPDREQRLRRLFAHQLRLRRLREQMTSVDFSEPRNRVLVEIADALQGISSQLTTASFALEEARMMLDGTHERLGLYVDTLAALEGRDQVIVAMKSVNDSSSKLVGAMQSLAQVSEQAAELDRLLSGYVGAEVIAAETEGIELNDTISIATLDEPVDVSQELGRYLEAGRARQASEQPTSTADAGSRSVSLPTPNNRGTIR